MVKRLQFGVICEQQLVFTSPKNSLKIDYFSISGSLIFFINSNEEKF
jgi:hypothetical protein